MHPLPPWILPSILFNILLYARPGKGSRPNLALGKPSSQSSEAWSGDAYKAVDGNRNPSYWDGSCTHTAENQRITWWMVDLERDHVISAVQITNRISNSDRLVNFSVEISSVKPSGLAGFPGRTSAAICAKPSGNIPAGATFYYRCQNSIRGRYIRVVKEMYPVSALTLCEFEAFGPGSWTLERESEPVGTANVLKVVPGTLTVRQCVKACFYHSGWPCQHILYHRVKNTCQLLRSFERDNTDTFTTYDLYTEIV